MEFHYNLSFNPKDLSGYDLQPSPFYVGDKSTYPPEIKNVTYYKIPDQNKMHPEEKSADIEKKRNEPKIETTNQKQETKEKLNKKPATKLNLTKSNQEPLYIDNKFKGADGYYFPQPTYVNTWESPMYICYPQPSANTNESVQPVFGKPYPQLPQQMFQGQPMPIPGQPIIMPGQPMMMQGPPMMVQSHQLISPYQFMYPPNAGQQFPLFPPQRSIHNGN